ncbi:hypothetical protein ACEWY4_026986 [Coilia grayii]|uniref:BTB domain-containing protein n=1 Tax=Coilia grayii TaxID=363190 RepID=A0ABD1IR61_9TELE
MGMFEQLLVNKLQKQQHRIQFCDIVIQAQDVSVPVHSSVLSAFSPRLCEFLSTLPALPGGRSRVIELEAVEGRTLLRLVRWLYTGTVEGEGRDLQKAADKLGITLFQERVEEEKRRGEGEEPLKDGAVGKRGNTERRNEEKRGMKRRGCKDAETQTDGGKHTVETDMQTDLDITSSQNAQCLYNRPSLVDFQSGMPPLDPIGQLPWVTETCFQTSTDVNALMALTGDTNAIPVELPSTLDESMVRQLISAVAVEPPDCAPSLFLPAPEDQPTGTERLGNAAAMEGGRAELVEGFEQFEGNIPEFISYFLDSTGPRRRGRRMRRSGRRARGGEKRGSERGSERARRPRGGVGKGAKEDKQTVGKVERRFPLREGRPADLMWRGVGGGRIGTSLHLPPRKKCRTRSYARQNCTQGKTELSQEKAPTIRRPRGRSRVRSLPVHARPCDPESDPLYPNLPPRPLTPPMLHAMPLPPAQSRSLLEQLLFELNQPSCAVEQLENKRSTLPASTTSPYSMPYSAEKADRIQGEREGEVVDSFNSLLLSLDQSLGIKSYTSIKDRQEGHHLGGEKRSEVCVQVHTPAQQMPKTSQFSRATVKSPLYRSGGKPCRWKTKVRGKKKTALVQETVLREEMFEERRMTRDQAKRLRASNESSVAAAPCVGGSEPQATPASGHLQQDEVATCKTAAPTTGKNMKILRQKLLGKKRKQESATERDSTGTSPSSRKQPRLSVVLQPLAPTQRRE